MFCGQDRHSLVGSCGGLLYFCIVGTTKNIKMCPSLPESGVWLSYRHWNLAKNEGGGKNAHSATGVDGIMSGRILPTLSGNIMTLILDNDPNILKISNNHPLHIMVSTFRTRWAAAVTKSEKWSLTAWQPGKRQKSSQQKLWSFGSVRLGILSWPCRYYSIIT